MIVSVTRGDLRDEFCMADEAFALSPISARAAQPSEEDYDAIREAFMETSRGRWFLGEYARRNRNADTRMVLDAVERIEESLAAQKQPVPDSGLAEALAAIRHAVDEARAAASAAFDGLALEENLARVRKGTRIIREISWRWREIGADARICDLLDSQVGAIDAGCDNIAAADPLIMLGAAFDLIEERTRSFDDTDAASPRNAEQDYPPPSPAAPEEMPAAAFEETQAAIVAENDETTMDISPSPTEAAVAPADAIEVTSEGGDDYDEAMLDMVALEMAAPDPADSDDDAEARVDDTAVEEISAAEPPPAEPEIIAQQPEPEPAPTPPTLQPSLQPSPEPSLEPSPEPSLGSTLIANGIVRRPNASKFDSLAPIRRMSQAEKIAFFS
jgi:hypothetical protein